MKRLLAICLALVFCGNASGLLLTISNGRPAAQSAASKRRLQSGTFEKAFKVRKDDSYKKLKFMEIVGSILRTAKSRHLKIKKIELGSNIKAIFQNPDINTALSQYINDKHFFKKLAFERKRYRKLKARHSQQTEPRTPPKTSKRKLAEFNFDPKFAGMPFPPFLMNGPHYYPETSLTVNAVPNPYPRAALVKEELEIQATERQNKFLEKLRKELRDTSRSEMDNLGAEALGETEKSRSMVATLTQLND
jgi:hypothetical protein